MALVLLLLLYYRWTWTPSLHLYEFVWLQCQVLSLVVFLCCEIEVPFPDLLLLCIWVTCICCLFVNQSQCPSLTDNCFSLFSGYSLWLSPASLRILETQTRSPISALISAFPSLTVGHSSLSVHLGLAVILMSSFCGEVHVELQCCCCPQKPFFHHCPVRQASVHHPQLY